MRKGVPRFMIVMVESISMSVLVYDSERSFWDKEIRVDSREVEDDQDDHDIIPIASRKRS